MFETQSEVSANVIIYKKLFLGFKINHDLRGYRLK